MILLKKIDRLYNYVILNNYYGWDPYDGLNNGFFYKIPNKYLKIAIIQFNKYSFLNLRPLFGTKKTIDVKGMALFGQAYNKIYTVTNRDYYLNESNRIYEYLISKSLINDYGYHCWKSHSFPYINISTKGFNSDNVCDIVGTSEVIKFLCSYYKITKDKSLIKVIDQSKEGLLNLFLDVYDSYLYFKYTPIESHIIVYNATALGLTSLLNIFELFLDEKIKNICDKLMTFLCDFQNSDGSWYYSKTRNGNIRKQYDFHQGYILDSLLSYYSIFGNKDLLSSIYVGSNYYNKLFDNSGKGFHRYPRKYPIDIHNQAQGIITFSKLYQKFGLYRNVLERIFKWTIINMMDRRGFFYYQKWPIIMNKIPYMRWSQAWMLLALSTLLEVENI